MMIKFGITNKVRLNYARRRPNLHLVARGDRYVICSKLNVIIKGRTRFFVGMSIRH